MSKQIQCWNCGIELKDHQLPISRHDQCQQCYEVLHCCLMCRFYMPGRPLDCDHDRADPPVEKSAANFCEYFRPVAGRFSEASDQRKQSAQSQLDALFGDQNEADEDSASEQEEDDVTRKLNDLFRD